VIPTHRERLLANSVCGALYNQLGIKMFVMSVVDTFIEHGPAMNTEDLKKVAECFDTIVDIVEALP
jgi:hypothetical protein